MRFATILLLLGACTPGKTGVEQVEVIEHPVADPVDVPVESDSRFVGTWLIEETVPHATYFASLWEFHADGTLSLVEDYSIGEPGYPWVEWTGGYYGRCSFGEAWASPDEATLQIDGDCEEGIVRQIELGFTSDTSGNAAGVGPSWLAVDGDTTGWSEPVWGWHFVKCEGDHSNCQPWTY